MRARVTGFGIAVLLLLVAGRPTNGTSVANAQQLVGPTRLPAPRGKPEVIPEQFIVELRPGVNQDLFISGRGLAPFFRYTLINGFAARMAQNAANRLAADPQVKSVSPDLVVHAFPKPSGGPGSGSGGSGTECPDTSGAMATPQVAPPGISRIGANSAAVTGAGVKVAIIDTGIDFCHPDLKENYQGGTNLVERGNKPPKDDNGHGTHVAGIIGAKNNAFGVVGVASEAHLYAVKVLNKDGSGSLSAVIKGLDWAVQNKMNVVNASLGALDLYALLFGPAYIVSSSMCTAVANAVAAGTLVVVASGNSADEALFYTPGNCPYSLAVSALADSDGLSGGGGLPLDYNNDSVADEEDDTFAETFSNWSNYCWDFDEDGKCETANADSLVVELMAPGVEILSTLPTYTVTLNDPQTYNKALNYDTLTGTSMATPHVSGVAALYIQANPGVTPNDIRIALTTGGECVGGGTSLALPIICAPPWPDDEFSGWPEPLVHVGP